MTTPESPAPQSAGLSAGEVVGLSTPADIQWALEQARSHHFMVTTKRDAMGPRAQACSGCDEPYPCPTKILATALEATAARLKEIDSLRESLAEVERQRRIDEEYEESVNESLRATLAERERELGEARAALLLCMGEIERLTAERDALKNKLAAAERVVGAARARLEVWTRETYVGVRDALAAYDALSRS